MNCICGEPLERAEIKIEFDINVTVNVKCRKCGRKYYTYAVALLYVEED